jgi:predicted DCC family thiol-disulfide oxidoreductase YuxK
MQQTDAPPSGARRSGPLLVWDGDCGFCKRSVLWLRRRVGLPDGDPTAGLEADGLPEDAGPSGFRTASWQRALVADPSLPLDEAACRQAVQLVEADGVTVRSGAAAIYRALAFAPGHGIWWWAYRYVPGFAAISAFAYRQVARNRTLVGRTARLLAGRDPEPPTFLRARRLFAVLCAVALFCACVSSAGQLPALIGPEGIWPASESLAELAADPSRIVVPTVFWLSTSAEFLVAVAWVGAVAAALAAAGIASRWTLLVGWFAYLSIVDVGSVFFDRQADRLLLEASFLGAVFVLPGALDPRGAAWRREPSAIGVFLLRLLLFRVVFFAGLAKFWGGEFSWGTGYGLEMWLQNQPLPHAGSLWLLASTDQAARGTIAFVTALLECVAPWFVLLGPRRPRALAGIAIVGIQIGTVVAGNVGFLPLVVCALAVLALDDRTLQLRQGPAFVRRVPVRVRLRLAAAAVLVLLAAVDQTRRLGGGRIEWLVGPRVLAQDLHLGIGYLFHESPTFARYHIDLQVLAQDGEDGYESLGSRFRPGLDGKPAPFLGPHVPRLDLLLAELGRRGAELLAARRLERVSPPAWFALVEPRDVSLVRRILAGSPPVWRAFGTAPPASPPRALRIRVVEQAAVRGEKRGEQPHFEVGQPVVIPPALGFGPGRRLTGVR